MLQEHNTGEYRFLKILLRIGKEVLDYGYRNQARNFFQKNSSRFFFYTFKKYNFLIMNYQGCPCLYLKNKLANPEAICLNFLHMQCAGCPSPNCLISKYQKCTKKENLDLRKNPKWRLYLYFHNSFSPIYSPCEGL